MPRIKVKQMDERTATVGVHFGGAPVRRKLHPGEIVEIDEDFEAGKYGGGEQSLLQTILATNRVEITLDPANRPLDYPDEDAARYTAPTYKSRGPEDDVIIAEAFERANRHMQSSKAPLPAVDPNSVAPPVQRGPGRPRRRTIHSDEKVPAR